MRVELQKILFPKVGVCTETKMYYRAKEKYFLENVDYGITLSKGGKVSFNTYFNGFSMAKWKKYTILEKLALRIKFSGKFSITLYTEEKIHDDVLKTILLQKVISSDSPTETVVEFPEGNGKGMYSFSVEAMEKDSVFYGGNYETEIEEAKLRDVKIAIDICTFRREKFVEKNMQILNDNIFNNDDSALKNHLEVFISDNGKTLDMDRIATEQIHIFPNKNYGGAGGFTRGLIEIKKCEKDRKITHALLMDDDIVIEPEALYKTYRVLTMLKDEYADAFIGGAMLRLDKQNIQEESGASWNAGYLKSLKKNLNLNKVKACLYNEVEEYTEFNAWWYCCFPTSVVTDTNLPLPLFIRGDDVEYGLRNMKHLILMNGICVWHEPFENKYSSFLNYYILRNQLIDNAFHFPNYGKKQLYRALVGSCLREISYYRYKNVDLILRGVRDFCKGPEWLMQQDSESLHKEIMAAGYRGADLSELNIPFDYTMYESSKVNNDTKKKKLIRILTMNGMLFSSKGINVVPMAGARPTNFYRKSEVLNYDVTSNKGFVTRKNYKEFVRCMHNLLKCVLYVNVNYEKAKKMYQTNGKNLRTLKFWNKFLDL